MDNPGMNMTDTEAEIRSRGLCLQGDDLPNVSSLKFSYRQAWVIGKQGCLGVRRRFWDPLLFAGTWYFICDGTDPDNFLCLYASSKGNDHRQKYTIGLWELVQGYWAANKNRIIYTPHKAPSKLLVLEGFSTEFYHAMLKCVYEGMVQIQLVRHRLGQLHASNSIMPSKLNYRNPLHMRDLSADGNSLSQDESTPTDPGYSVEFVV
ncbi:hypothetical protein BdWA1_000725 [Babesia duncani]|uniref:Uncharacterized protein n=1 Tax=Babesia duncani TaxID=323732 RepID=A0AAD9PMT8_9APIC|nr:hypothetical protein BdWA1_000725 [Babesia duncani]